MKKKKTIDIIVPVFNEEKNLVTLYNSINQQIGKLQKYSWNIIFINDGSSDNSIEVLKNIAKNDQFVKIVDFTRNFGKELALTAGLDLTNADAAIFIDADLQHPPQLIPDMLKSWENGHTIVTTVRKSTKHLSIFRKVNSILFYWVLNKISDIKFIPKSTDYRLLDKRVINVLKGFTERNRMFRGLIDWLGFDTTYIYFEAPERKKEKARYSTRKLITLAINSIVSFSLIPLKFAGYLGLFISVASFILLIAMLIVRFIFKSSLFSSLSFVVVSNTIMIGIVLTCLGFIALYISQIHSEVINRPLYVIKEKINFYE